MSLINFDLIKIKDDLDQYQKSKNIPESFIKDYSRIQMLLDVYQDLSEEDKSLAEELISDLKSYWIDNRIQIEQLLKKDYDYFLDDSCTNSAKWLYPAIQGKYRKDLNPVRAIYYELKALMFFYNSNDPYHNWLVDVFKEPETIDSIIACMKIDIEKLRKIISKFYPIISFIDGSMPLLMSHIMQLRSSMKSEVKVLENFKLWNPDE